MKAKNHEVLDKYNKSLFITVSKKSGYYSSLKSLFFRFNDQKTERLKAGICKPLKFKVLLTAHYSSTPSLESFPAKPSQTRPPLISIPLKQKAIKPAASDGIICETFKFLRHCFSFGRVNWGWEKEKQTLNSIKIHCLLQSELITFEYDYFSMQNTGRPIKPRGWWGPFRDTSMINTMRKHCFLPLHKWQFTSRTDLHIILESTNVIQYEFWLEGDEY